MFVIFDLDGTLALNEHRRHFVDRGPARFGEALPILFAADLYNWPVVRLLQDLSMHHEVEIWSGRSDKVEAKTRKWLAEAGIDHIKRRHRPDGDHTSDVELKRGWLKESSRCPDIVFDDRDSVVAMWRAEGIVCCQVAPGSF